MMDENRGERRGLAETGLLVPAAAYFAIVFAFAFALGTVRVLLIAPRVGELAGAAIELPIVLAISWLISRRVMRRWQVPGDAGSRLFVGLAALAMLLAAEILLGVTLFDRDLAGQLAAMTRGSGALGLAAQIVFGLIPLVQARAGPTITRRAGR